MQHRKGKRVRHNAVPLLGEVMGVGHGQTLGLVADRAQATGGRAVAQGARPSPYWRHGWLATPPYRPASPLGAAFSRGSPRRCLPPSRRQRRPTQRDRKADQQCAMYLAPPPTFCPVCCGCVHTSARACCRACGRPLVSSRRARGGQTLCCCPGCRRRSAAAERQGACSTWRAHRCVGRHAVNWGPRHAGRVAWQVLPTHWAHG